MKPRGSELGRLSSQFFAYIQLKNKDIIRTGEIAPALGLTPVQERKLLFRLADAGWIVRLKRGIYLAPPRIPAGGRYGPGAALMLLKLMEEEGADYQICGPTAFYYHGFTGQIPNVTYVYNSRISGSRTIGGLQFQFTKVESQRLGSAQAIRVPEGMSVLYGSKSRTLMDAVYDWSRFNSLPIAYDWIAQGLQKESKLASQLTGDAIQYGNQATKRRVGYLLTTLGVSKRILNRLHLQLNDSKALIPWIPGQPAKGTIDRRWGVIVNG